MSLGSLVSARRHAGSPVRTGRLDAADVVLVHAAPDALDVAVRTDDGELFAEGQNLARTADRQMARLTVCGERIVREDLWPDAEDLGRPVILPGGEIGILLKW